MRKLILLLIVLLGSASVEAYTGSFALMPAAAGGPDHTTVSNFDIDTGSANPQMIVLDLNFIESIIIETSEPISGPLLVKEEPEGEQPAFSFTVPQKINDVLIQATVFMWGPDVESLSINHIHNNEPPVAIEATKVQPLEYDENGNVLWRFTTPSFSEFMVGDKSSPEREFPMVYATLIALASISCCILFKE